MKRFLGYLFFSSLVFSSAAQTQQDGDSISARQFITSLYSRVMRNQSLLYNGNEYVSFDGPSKGHSYFISEYWEEGTVTYEGESFHDVPMLYDVVHDELIIEHYDQDGYNVDLKLHKERVASFTLLDHYFVYISADSMQGTHYRSGFYDILYNGTTQLLAKRKKDAFEQIDQGMLITAFSNKDRYLLKLDGVYYSVKSKGTLLKLLKDRKKELSQYIRKSNLDFRFNKERSLIETVRHYNNLVSHE